METKAHHAFVGLFAVLLIAAGSFFTFWLMDQVGDQDYASYDIIFDGPVRGLRESGEVRFNGIQVGEVTDIGLDPQNPQRVIARVRVLAETPVRLDSFALLEPLGLTGLSYVQITGGSPDADRLYSPPSRPPPRIFARQGQLDALTEGAGDVLNAAQLALIRVSTLLNEENIGRVEGTLANIEELTGRLAEEDALIEDLRVAVQSLDTAAQEISLAAQSVNSLGSTAEGFLVDQAGPAMENTALAAASVNQASADFNTLITTVQPHAERFSRDGLDELTLAASDLRRLIQRLDRIAQEIEDNPAALVAGEPREEVEVPQ